jgi:nucleotide-binding universal stress UspA family protein
MRQATFLVAIHLELSMSNPIVVGVDPLHQDDSPLRLAAGLARMTGEPVVAIASYPHDPITDARTGGMVEADLRVDAAEKLEALAAGVDAELAVVGGRSPARALHDAAVARNAGMIVVGSTRKARLTPGSTAERLLQGGPCPVAIAPAALSENWTPRRVGVGFIDRADGREALRYGAALAGAADASLHALTAVEPPDWSQSAVIASYRVTGGLESSRAAAQRALYVAIENLPGCVPASREVVVRHAADALITLSSDVDLLVCGSRVYGPLRSVPLGSVTRRLTRSASCPVVIVPHGAERSIGVLAEEYATTAP